MTEGARRDADCDAIAAVGAILGESPATRAGGFGRSVWAWGHGVPLGITPKSTQSTDKHCQYEGHCEHTDRRNLLIGLDKASDYSQKYYSYYTEHVLI